MQYRNNYVMTYLTILCVLALISAQAHSQPQLQDEAPSQTQFQDDAPSQTQFQDDAATLVHNKNINIIVNIDPEEVANELWKLIEARLSDRTGHLTNSKSVIDELQRAVLPLMLSTRRTSQSILQVANQLDKITRRALTRDTPNIDNLDEEIIVRDVVADMMATLKMIFSKLLQSKIDEADKTKPAEE